MLPDKTDILVVGGGPAGSCAATMLARRGYDVLVIDKAHHPRETVGESVLPSAWKYFDMLGVSDEITSKFVKKAGGVVVWGDDITQIAFRDFSYDRPGLHVERDVLDYILLKNAQYAGARLYEGARAESFRSEGDQRSVVLVNVDGRKHEIICRQLVDASGQASFVARQLGCRDLDPDFRFVSLWGYFDDSRYVSSGGIVRRFEEIPHFPPMTFVSRLGGWGWSWHIPMRKVTSVGIVVPVEDYRREAALYPSLEEYFRAMCGSARFLGRLLEDARLVNGGIRVLRDFSYVSQTVAGPGFLVVGDAAGFVDPIFSIGVVMALYSGHLAAWTTDRILQNRALPDATRSLFTHQMHGRYELARTMALPGVGADAPNAAEAYFDFFSKSEKELMWSAASMTTRSGNLVRVSGGDNSSSVLKRVELTDLQFS